FLASLEAFQKIEAEAVMEFGRRGRVVEPRSDEEVSDVLVGLQQHVGREQHVVDANHAVFVQLAIVDEGRSAAQREIHRVVEVVIEVRAGRDHEVDEAAIHQLDHAAAEPGRRHRARHRQADRRVVLGGEHFLGENLARFRQPSGVERLKALVNQPTDVLAARGTVVTNRFSGQKLLAGVPGRTGCAMRQSLLLFFANSLTSAFVTGEQDWLSWVAFTAIALVVIVGVWVWRKGRPFAQGYVFRASRWSRGNHLFSTQALTTENSVVQYTPRWFGKREETIHMAHISSVKIETGMLLSDVFIETSGGSDPIVCHGHTKSDAARMKQLIE